MKSWVRWLIYALGVVLIIAVHRALNNIEVATIELGFGDLLIFSLGCTRLFQRLGDWIFGKELKK